MKALCVLVVAVFAAANCCNLINEIERMETAFNIDDNDQPIYKLALSEGTNSSYIITTTNEDPFRAMVHVSPPDPLTCGPAGLIPRQGDGGVMRRTCPGILMFGNNKRQFGFTVVAPECGCVEIRVQTFIADESDKPIRFIDSSVDGPLTQMICRQVNKTTDFEEIKQNLRERPLVCVGPPERALPICPPPPHHGTIGHHGTFGRQRPSGGDSFGVHHRPGGHHRPSRGHHRPGHHGRRPGRHNPRIVLETQETEGAGLSETNTKRYLGRQKRQALPPTGPMLPPKNGICPKLIPLWEKIREQCCTMAGPNYHTCANSIIMEFEDNMDNETYDESFNGDFKPDTETVIGGRDCCMAGRNHASIDQCSLFKNSQWWAQNREAIGIFKARKCSQVGIRCCMRARRSGIGGRGQGIGGMNNEEIVSGQTVNSTKWAHECCTLGQSLSSSQCRSIRTSSWWNEKRLQLPLFKHRKCIFKATHCCRMQAYVYQARSYWSRLSAIFKGVTRFNHLIHFSNVKQVVNSDKFEPVQRIENREVDDENEDDEFDDDDDDDDDQIEERRMTYETCYEKGKQEGQYIKKEESCYIKRPLGWRRMVRRNFRRNQKRMCNLKFNAGCENEKKARFEEKPPIPIDIENPDLQIDEPSWDEFDTEESRTVLRPDYTIVNNEEPVKRRDENEVEINNNLPPERMEYNEIPL